MKMVEQNISGVKLERLRQNAVKKHKILRKLFPVCLILFIGLTLVKNRFLFASISEYGWGDPATQGAFWMLVGNLMLSVIFAGVIFGFYYMLVYKMLRLSGIVWTMARTRRKQKAESISPLMNVIRPPWRTSSFWQRPAMPL